MCEKKEDCECLLTPTSENGSASICFGLFPENEKGDSIKVCFTQEQNSEIPAPSDYIPDENNTWELNETEALSIIIGLSIALLVKEQKRLADKN